MQTEPDTAELKARMERIEQIQNSMVKEHYALDAEIKGIMKDIGYIKEGQDKVSAGINKILWAVGLSILAAFMTFVVNGGLNISP